MSDRERCPVCQSEIPLGVDPCPTCGSYGADGEEEDRERERTEAWWDDM